jgi:hypothetical protein
MAGGPGFEPRSGLQVDDPTAANELWAEIERDVMDLAP